MKSIIITIATRKLNLAKETIKEVTQKQATRSLIKGSCEEEKNHFYNEIC
jgi:hypothetical protein